MGYPMIKPREFRLTIDVVRDALKVNPTVLLVTGRTMTATTLRIHTLTPEQLDVQFARNFFYLDNSRPESKIMMVPFELNGDV